MSDLTPEQIAAFSNAARRLDHLAMDTMWAELTALREREGRLANALRGHCIELPREHESGAPGHYTCRECMAEWVAPADEKHAPDCLATPGDKP